jgi:hypothetical protein
MMAKVELLETVWKVVLGGYFATLARMRKPYPTDLSDAEWKYIEPHVPAPKGHGRPRTHSLREILNAVFYLLKSGCQWRLLPHDLSMSRILWVWFFYFESVHREIASESPFFAAP